jgi:hypothetical protein
MLSTTRLQSSAVLCEEVQKAVPAVRDSRLHLYLQKNIRTTTLPAVVADKEQAWCVDRSPPAPGRWGRVDVKLPASCRPAMTLAEKLVLVDPSRSESLNGQP